MRTLNQVIAVTALNIRNLPRRVATSFVAVVGVAAVVLVFAAVMSMAKGFERTMTLAGAVDSAIVIRAGSMSGSENPPPTPLLRQVRQQYRPVRTL